MRLHDGRIDRGRFVPFEPEQHGPIGAVAQTRERQRTVQLRRDLRRAVEQALLSQVAHERRRGVHGSHRVRTGRTDADLEDVKDAQVHAN